jgi:hypothetical protein
MLPISWLSHVHVQSKDKELVANAYRIKRGKPQANGALETPESSAQRAMVVCGCSKRHRTSSEDKHSRL